MRKQYLRRRVRCSSSLFQLLHEHFAQYNIVLVPEYCAEHHSDAIGLRFNVPANEVEYFNFFLHVFVFMFAFLLKYRFFRVVMKSGKEREPFCFSLLT